MITTAPRPHRRRWPRRLLLVFGTVVVTLLGAEFALWALDLYPPMPRAYPGQYPDRRHDNFETDPVVGWRLRPGVEFEWDDEGGVVKYRADADGRRIGGNSAGATSRTIVLAGDSYIFGVGVQYEDSLAGLLQQRYPGTRVVNLAQPGFGLDQMMLSVIEQGLPLRPVLVIVGIYPMDLSRSLTAYRDDLGFNKPTFRLDGGKLVRCTTADRPSALGAMLQEHSRLFGLWRRTQRNVGVNHGVGSWWGLNEAILENLRTKVAAEGSKLLLVHVPMHDWRNLAGLSAFCERHDLPLINPVEVSATKPAGMYYEPGGHFTAQGHRHVGDMVASWIDAQGLLR